MSKRLSKIDLRNLYKPGQNLPAVGKPFALRNKVAERSEKKPAASCLGEMSSLLDCWKANGFNDSSCAQEIATFQMCVTNTVANRTGSTSDRLTSKELNAILRSNPLPKS